MINQDEISNRLSLMKSIKTQQDVLKARYDQQTTYLDRLARLYGEQNQIFKMVLKYFSIGLIFISFFALNFFVTLGMVIFSSLIFFLDEHYEFMEARFYQLSKDLDISEKQLKQAVAVNMDLENQLTVALQKNQEVSNELGKIKEEVMHLSEKILAKDQVIEQTRDLLEGSLNNIQALVLETIEIKKGVSEKARLFLQQLNSTEKKIKGLFGDVSETSYKLKKSIEFREQMDRYLKENFPEICSHKR